MSGTNFRGPVGGWIVANGQDFVYAFGGTAGLTVYGLANVPAYQTAFGSATGTNILLATNNANATVPGGGGAVGGIKLSTVTNTAITFSGASDILQLTTGAIISDNATSRTIGTVALPGRITVNPFANVSAVNPFPSTELFFYNNSTNTLTINSQLTQLVYPVAAVFSSGFSGNVILTNATNNYTGGTYINGSGVANFQVTATTPGSLSSGQVQVNNAILSYGCGSPLDHATNFVSVINNGQLVLTRQSQHGRRPLLHSVRPPKWCSGRLSTPAC